MIIYYEVLWCVDTDFGTSHKSLRTFSRKVAVRYAIKKKGFVHKVIIEPKIVSRVALEFYEMPDNAFDAKGNLLV